MSKDRFMKRLYPDKYYDTIFDVDLNLLKEKGIKNLLIDLDNTIIPRKEREVSEDLKEWFAKLFNEGFKMCIISNNWKTRVGKAIESLDLPLVARAAKPRKKAFEQGMKILRANRDQTAVIGDQIFTDVLGGNRMDLFTILVVPLSKSDLFYTKILRRLERSILKRDKRRQLC